MTSKAAQELGKKGGQAKSERKTAAVRKNAAKPRGKWVTALYYTAYSSPTSSVITGLVMCKGNLTTEQEEYKAREDLLIMHNVTEAETHALGWESSRIKV